MLYNLCSNFIPVVPISDERMREARLYDWMTDSEDERLGRVMYQFHLWGFEQPMDPEEYDPATWNWQYLADLGTTEVLWVSPWVDDEGRRVFTLHPEILKSYMRELCLPPRLHGYNTYRSGAYRVDETRCPAVYAVLEWWEYDADYNVVVSGMDEGHYYLTGAPSDRVEDVAELFDPRRQQVVLGDGTSRVAVLTPQREMTYVARHGRMFLPMTSLETGWPQQVNPMMGWDVTIAVHSDEFTNASGGAGFDESWEVQTVMYHPYGSWYLDVSPQTVLPPLARETVGSYLLLVMDRVTRETLWTTQVVLTPDVYGRQYVALRTALGCYEVRQAWTESTTFETEGSEVATQKGREYLTTPAVRRQVVHLPLMPYDELRDLMPSQHARCYYAETVDNEIIEERYAPFFEWYANEGYDHFRGHSPLFGRGYGAWHAATLTPGEVTIKQLDPPLTSVELELTPEEQ